MDETLKRYSFLVADNVTHSIFLTMLPAYHSLYTLQTYPVRGYKHCIPFVLPLNNRYGLLAFPLLPVAVS